MAGNAILSDYPDAVNAGIEAGVAVSEALPETFC